MQLKKEPNRSERMLRKKRKEKKNIARKYRERKLKRRKKEGRAALHSKRRKREDLCLTMKWNRVKKGREALHSKRRKREDFFGEERKREGKIHTQDRKKMEQKGRKNVVPGTWILEPVPGHEEERRKRGSIDICNSWFCSLVVRRKEERWEASVSAIPGSARLSSKGKMEEGKHRFPVLLPRSSSLGAHGRTSDRWKCGWHQRAPRGSVTHGRISGISAPHVES